MNTKTTLLRTLHRNPYVRTFFCFREYDGHRSFESRGRGKQSLRIIAVGTKVKYQLYFLFLYCIAVLFVPLYSTLPYVFSNSVILYAYLATPKNTVRKHGSSNRTLVVDVNNLKKSRKLVKLVKSSRMRWGR